MDRWTSAQKADALLMQRRYDKVVKVSAKPERTAYRQRNRHLVDYSAYCICYCGRPNGGTAYTVRYAQSKSLELFNTAGYDLVQLRRGGHW